MNEEQSQSRYAVTKDGVIKDTQTGLEWYVGPDKDTNWYEANAWVNGLKVAGGGWRLPSRDELKGLYQQGVGDRNMDPGFKTSGCWVWSGKVKNVSSAWGFFFYFGSEPWYDRSYADRFRVFAVRSLL